MRVRSAISSGEVKQVGGDAGKWLLRKRSGEGKGDLPSGADDGRLIDELEATLGTYLPPRDMSAIRRAYLFSAEAHSGQVRMSGEPYISHPVKVAQAMAQLHFDATTIIAGILHDVLEDTHITKHQLARKFGAEVAKIVDGVSKIDHLQFETRESSQAANFQKMILAMSKDPRVILLKLIDRLHNMRTLHYLPVHKQKLIARETLEIYAPVAQRLGMDKVRREFEELGFKALHPLRYRVLSEAIKKSERRCKKLMIGIERSISKRLVLAGISHEIGSRRKSVYSVYKKMRTKNLSFSRVLDLFALRLIIDRVDNCYRVLGLAHSLYKPVPGCFKDYIAIPKTNGYQSLHTVLFGTHAVPIEIQIRTREMDKVAEQGVAAHAMYKAGKGGSNTGHSFAQVWTHRLMELHKHAGDSAEFLENVKVDLFPDEVYVFTPQGEIMNLPRGATALDFAFAVHTDIGLSCAEALINNRRVALSTELKNGQSVEIITDKKARPTPLWLGFTVTAKARAAIHSCLKKTSDKSSVKLGKRLLDNALKSHGAKPGEIKSGQWSVVLRELGLGQQKDLFREIGLGNQMPSLITRRLLEPPKGAHVADTPLDITGTEGVVVTYAKCCHPIPGDNIVGILNSGKGLVVHRDGCRNISGHNGKNERNLLLQWSRSESSDAEYSAAIRIITHHRRGMLAVISDKIAQMDSNIENISIEERPGAMALLNFTISVKNRKHLADIIRKIRNISNDVQVSRVK